MNQIGIWGVLTVLCFTLSHGVQTVTVDFSEQSELTEQESVLYTNKDITFCLSPEGADTFSYAYALQQGPEDDFGKWKKIKQGNDAISVNQVNRVKFRRTEKESGVVHMHTYHIVPDDVKPEIVLETRSGNDQTTQNPIDLEQWQNQDISCSVKITDDGCGLKQIGCRVMGEVLWAEDYPEEEIKTNATIDFMLTKETNQNGASFEIYAIDKAGNETLYQNTYYLDKQTPVISVNGIENRTFYLCAQQLQIIVQENIWQYANVCIETTRQAGGTKPVSEKVHLPLQAAQSTFLREFQEEGDYTVGIYAYDKAGNQSEPYTVSFRVDLSAPKVSIIGVESGKSYCIEKELTVIVEEFFYKDNHVQITAKKDIPENEKVYSVGEWKNQANISKLSHVFREDGCYSLYVTAQDAAGHRTVYDKMQFTIDRTAPQIEIKGVVNGDVKSGTVPIRFCVQELFYDTAQTQIAIVKEGREGTSGQVIVPAYTADGYRSETEHMMSGEGKYHIEMQTADTAGNTATAEKAFSIDDTPPMIGYLDEIQKTYPEGFSLPSNFSHYITDMSLFTYYVYINGKVFDEKTKLTKPGNYIIKIEATDEAGNTAVKSTQFIIPRKVFSILSGKLPLSGGRQYDDTKAHTETKTEHNEEQQREEDGDIVSGNTNIGAGYDSNDAGYVDKIQRKKLIIKSVGILLIVLACGGLVMCRIDRKSSV